jgi:biopolymer transport protein ExbD
MENHPQLAEIVADIEPPPPKVPEDETRLDMNPLIDVALVLLIFFILTTTYESIRKVLDLPGTQQQDVKGPLVVTKEQVEKLMVLVEVRQVKDQVTVKVEGQTTPVKDLEEALRNLVRGSRRTEMLIDAGPGVEWGVLVAIQDAGKGAGMSKAYYLKQPDKK